MPEKMKPKRGFVVVVPRLPSCDFCDMEGVERPARYDFRTIYGSWANGCDKHWQKHRSTPSLGVGNGQMLIVAEEVAV